MKWCGVKAAAGVKRRRGGVSGDKEDVKMTEVKWP